MIIIFSGKNIAFTWRIINKIGMSIIFPLILSLIFVLNKMYLLSYKEPLFYIFPVYFLYFFTFKFFESRIYIKSIEYDDGKKEFLFTIKRFDKEELHKVPLRDLEAKTFLYGVYTRTSNYYIKFKFDDKISYKQYDYKPWTYEVMKSVIDKIENIKTKEPI